jgi:hypothetical protein
MCFRHPLRARLTLFRGAGYPLQHARSSLMHSESTATQEALRVVFCTQFQRLHLQAYVLTGCPKLAVDCVLEAFDMVSDSFVASPEFAYEASRLATIKSGLRRVLPEIKQHALNESMNADRLLPIYSGNETTISRETFRASLHRLDVFHRAVLLLRLYEGYRAHEVSLLLRLPPEHDSARVDRCTSCPGVLPHWNRRRRSPCEGYFAAQPMRNMGRHQNSQTHPAAAAVCARSH